MEYKYRITFAHVDDKATDDTLKSGTGTVDIITDVPIETDEQRKEVAKQIGLAYKKTQIAITKIEAIPSTGAIFGSGFDNGKVVEHTADDE